MAIKNENTSKGYDLHDAAEVAAEALKNSLHDVGKSTSEAYQSGIRKANEYEQKFEESIQRKPLLSIALASLVGVLLGLLFSSKMK